MPLPVGLIQDCLRKINFRLAQFARMGFHIDLKGVSPKSHTPLLANVRQIHALLLSTFERNLCS
jgi:hypothetical protein